MVYSNAVDALATEYDTDSPKHMGVWTNFANKIFKFSFSKENYFILIKTSLKFISNGLTDTKSLPVPMLSQFPDASPGLNELIHPAQIPVYPILSCDSRFRLIINHVGYTRASHFDGFVQDCSNSIANALELLQSCTKPLIWCIQYDISSWCLWWHHNDELLQSCTKPLIWCIQYDIPSWCLWWHHNDELLQSCTKPLIWCIQYDISSWCLWWHHNDELLQSCTKPLIWCIQYDISFWCLWWHHNSDCDSSLLAVTLWYDRVGLLYFIICKALYPFFHGWIMANRM